MTDPNSIYGELRYWLVWVSAFGIVIKAYFSVKKNASEWMALLLDNHLSHIQAATTATAETTKDTNDVLRESAGKLDMLQATIVDYQTKNLQVWMAVTENLAILKDRSRAVGASAGARRKTK